VCIYISLCVCGVEGGRGPDGSTPFLYKAGEWVMDIGVYVSMCVGVCGYVYAFPHTSNTPTHRHIHPHPRSAAPSHTLSHTHTRTIPLFHTSTPPTHTHTPTHLHTHTHPQPRSAAHIPQAGGWRWHRWGKMVAASFGLGRCVS
jgi:hypothetical protein